MGINLGNLKPVPTKGGGGGGSKRESEYGLNRNKIHQLYILGQLNEDEYKDRGFMLPLETAKELFGYPTDKQVKPLTWMGNANTSLKKHGPSWLRLGKRVGGEDEDPEIVFRHNKSLSPDLPTTAEFCDQNDISGEIANENLDSWGLPNLGSLTADAETEELEKPVKKAKGKKK